MVSPDPLVERAAQSAAHAVLSKLLESSSLVETVTVAIASAPELTVMVRVSPPNAVETSDLTPCAADVLSVLGSTSHPLTTSGVLRELARRGAVHGESTVKRTLARLVRAGRIVSRTTPPRGYHLPGAI